MNSRKACRIQEGLIESNQTSKLLEGGDNMGSQWAFGVAKVSVGLCLYRLLGTLADFFSLSCRPHITQNQQLHFLQDIYCRDTSH
jgi:hypothetical protein